MDHTNDGRWLDAMSDDLARSDPRWSRRWRLAQALMPGHPPTWSALAANGALLVVAAALLIISVGTGQGWLLVLVVAVFALGMRPIARSTRGARLPTAAARAAHGGRVTRDDQA